MRGEQLTMHDQKGKLLVTANSSRNRLYKLRMGLRLKDSSYLNLAATNESRKWHAQFGHINLETIKSMIQKELVIGLPNVTFGKEVCGSCLMGKQIRHVFPQATSYRATKRIELVHGDLCGPITPSTKAGSKYIFVLIDDHSRYIWSILLKDKSEAFEKFKKLKIHVEQETGEKIQIFRTDRG